MPVRPSLGATLRSLSLLALLGSSLATPAHSGERGGGLAGERRLLQADAPVRLPAGILSWSGLDVRAGQPRPASHGSSSGLAGMEGTWTVDLVPSRQAQVNRRGLILELPRGLAALASEHPSAVRLSGPDGSVTLTFSLLTASGREAPLLALPMGDRVYVELFDLEPGSRLVIGASGLERSSQAGLGRHDGPERMPLLPHGAGIDCGGEPCSFVQVAAGELHSLGLTASGRVLAWGSNAFGQLGNGNDGGANSPVPVVVQDVGGGGALSGIASIAAGWHHSLAVTLAGEVRAWGQNASGQLGDGTTSHRQVPVVVAGVGGIGALSGITQVAGGRHHTLAVDGAGEVRAWGGNSSGQLGDGSLAQRLTPVITLGVGGAGSLGGVTQLAAGEMHSLARLASGEVRAWGSNVHGQLGDGTATASSTPVIVSAVGGGGALTGIEAVACGYHHSVALTALGEVLAWGWNLYGQLGDGTTTSRSLPDLVVDVGGAGVLSGIESISAGQYHSIVLTLDGEARTWGFGGYGQLGDGGLASSAIPVIVEESGGGALPGIAAVAAGGLHSHALLSSGDLLSWGFNVDGQLANGSSAYLALATCVRGSGGPLSDVVQVAAGDQHSLALLSDGRVLAWGYNGNGALGDGTIISRHVPVFVQDIGGGGELDGITALAAGALHSLALTAGGQVVAWGHGLYGQLGVSSTTDSLTPVVVHDVGGGGALTGIAGIAAGLYHSLAVTAAGEVRAWGRNAESQLGDGTNIGRQAPVAVVGVGGAGSLTGAAQVASRGYHALALLTSGEVRAWGLGASGQLGDGVAASSATPVVVSDVGGGGALSGIGSVGCGTIHSLAVTTSGEVRAWGRNSSGQLGDGSLTDSAVPVVVSGVGGAGLLGGVEAVAGGNGSSVALLASGEIRAWGLNANAMLGDGSFDDSATPVITRSRGGDALSGAGGLACGGYHALAVLTGTGEVRAWGQNLNGQLGDGFDADVPVPEPSICAVAGNAAPTCGIVMSEVGCAARELVATAEDPDGDPLDYDWSGDCVASDPSVSITTSVLGPLGEILRVEADPACAVSCTFTVSVDDGQGTPCTETVSFVIESAEPPVLSCPPDTVVECDDSAAAAFAAWQSSFGAIAACGDVTLMADLQPGLPLAFDDFDDVSSYQFNGSAALIHGCSPAPCDPIISGGQSVLRLTDTTSQSGSIFLTNEVSLASDASFHADFCFRILDPVGIGDADGIGADGLVFVLQTVSNTAGGGGGGMGYQGIIDSVGIEFDTFNNGEINGNHVGIDLDGSVASVVAASVTPRLNDGMTWYAWVDYDGVTDVLEVRATTSPMRPAMPLLSTTVDLVAVLGQTTAFAGFTSGTGAGGGTHEITCWNMASTYSPALCGQEQAWTMFFTASDECGNTSTCTRTFRSEDLQPPQLASAASDIVVECDDPDPGAAISAWLASNGGASATDACGGVTWTNDYSGLADGCGGTGTALVTFTATDECGNDVSTSASVAIVDTTPPLVEPPTALVLECDGAGNVAAIAAWLAANGAASATDACGGVTWTNAYSGLSDGCGGTGTALVTFTATDECGNAVSTSASVTIVDTTPPSIACPAPILVSCAEEVPAPDASGILAAEGCGLETVTHAGDVIVDQSCVNRFTVQRTWRATDECGLESECVQLIVVEDTTPPVLTPAGDVSHCLWPPNHRYVCFTAAELSEGLLLADDCESGATWRISGCSSSQPDDATGDGHTTEDCVVSPDGQQVCMRAERDGGDPAGRTYAVMIEATDACGNSSEAPAASVHVPHDQSPRARDCRDAARLGLKKQEALPWLAGP